MALPRCPWCEGFDLDRHDHDTEWGVPLHDDRALFELINLEGAQAGLSWSTVLKKRDTYRLAFDPFDPEKIARYDAQKVVELLANPGIVRNRLKVAATITNAQAYLALQASGQRFADFVWQSVNGRPLQPARHSSASCASKDARIDASNR
jgi:DNA-3-methyladenine glycosylase I